MGLRLKFRILGFMGSLRKLAGQEKKGLWFKLGPDEDLPMWHVLRSKGTCHVWINGLRGLEFDGSSAHFGMPPLSS